MLNILTVEDTSWKDLQQSLDQRGMWLLMHSTGPQSNYLSWSDTYIQAVRSYMWFQGHIFSAEIRLDYQNIVTILGPNVNIIVGELYDHVKIDLEQWH